jgi:adenylate cyclase
MDVERKLAAILCADVYGYSRLMGEDEEATHRTLISHRKVIDGLIEEHHGRFVNSAGDSVLAEFASVVNAVQCAVEIQTALKSENSELSPERRMEFRIGINLGDVMVDGEQIYGDGVNVAARLESLANPGGICISGKVHEEVGNKLALSREDIGEQAVKNIAKPVRVFRVTLDDAKVPAPTPNTSSVARKYVRSGVFSLVGLAIILATAVFVQHLSLKPPPTHTSIPPEQAPSHALPDKPSIAVLPFTNMSGDHDQDYFSDGLTDDLTTALSRIPDLFVIARTSAFTYKGKAVDVHEIGRQLGVRYVRKAAYAADTVRITAQLVDATTGDHIWAENYDRPLHDIFSLQDEIVRRIATTLSLQLTLQGRGPLFKKRTNNLEAYDNFLRALEYMLNLSKDGDEKARQSLGKAIALDPNYSDAYAEVAWVYQNEGVQEFDLNFVDKMFQAAQRAISLDDSNPFAYTALSAAYVFSLRSKRIKRLDASSDYDQSLTAAQRAITIDPNFALGYSVLAYVLESSGRPADAIVVIKKALRLDPNNHGSPGYSLVEALAYTYMGWYEEAITAYKQELAHNPNDLIAHEWLAASYAGVGRMDDAHAEAAEVMRISRFFARSAKTNIYSKKKRTARPQLCSHGPGGVEVIMGVYSGDSI